jgi:dTDP-4-dehydrorhamnose reductase
MLIIGGSGLVGSTLIEYANNHYDVHITTNKNEIKFNASKITKIDFFEDQTSIIKLIKKLNPDFVINMVAHPSVDMCESDHALADLLHVKIPSDIALACKDIDSKLIQFSTDAVFDGKLNKKYTEDNEPNPVNYYGKTRLRAEKIILETSRKNVVLRTAVIYGWHKRSRFSDWIVQSLRVKKIVDPHMDQYNTPTLVDDLAQAILKICKMDVSGLYHAVGKTCLSRYEFAQVLAEKFGLDTNLIKPVTSEEKKQIAPRPAKTCLDAHKLEKSIGFDFHDVKTGVSFIFDKSKF